MKIAFREFKEGNIFDNYAALCEQVLGLVNTLNAYDQIAHPTGQLILQKNNDSESTDWSTGTGKIVDKDIAWEQQFRYLQPELKNTPIDSYLNWLGIKVWRTRIMIARPKSCYSIHRDLSPRLHLPIKTNDQCYFLFTKPETLIHMPTNGKTYWIDTRCEHTFLNGSLEPRIHLVMNTEYSYDHY